MDSWRGRFRARYSDVEKPNDKLEDRRHRTTDASACYPCRVHGKTRKSCCRARRLSDRRRADRPLLTAHLLQDAILVVRYGYRLRLVILIPPVHNECVEWTNHCSTLSYRALESVGGGTLKRAPIKRSRGVNPWKPLSSKVSLLQDWVDLHHASLSASIPRMVPHESISWPPPLSLMAAVLVLILKSFSSATPGVS